MDNLDDSKNVVILDSAYSNSCSNNSQSRRSHSSNSANSGSSGYGGNPSTSGYKKNKTKYLKTRLKHKVKKKFKKKSLKREKKHVNVQTQTEIVSPQPKKEFKLPKEKKMDDVLMSHSSDSHAEKGVASLDICTSGRTSYKEKESFSSVISLHDGIVMYATTSITTVLGYPKDMWIGKSFLNFVHEKDRKSFDAHIKNGFIVPKNALGMHPNDTVMPTNVVCRLRRYRGINTGFGVRERLVNYNPFLLKFSFKELKEQDEGITYLVVEASPYISAFKMPYQILFNAVAFVIRHNANGSIEYVDPEAVSYLGYVPNDLQEKNALQLYHPHDLDYLQKVYVRTVREGSAPRSSPFRMFIQNGGYIKLETEWSCFINPWSKKLECVIAKHHVIGGPKNPDVFQTADQSLTDTFNIEDRVHSQRIRDNIVRIMNEVTTKPAKMQLSNRCKDLAAFIKTSMDETPKPKDNLSCDIHETANSYYGSRGKFASCPTSTGIIEEQESVMFGGISSHHDYSDSKSSSDTSIDYSQLNYNDNLQRFFDSHQPYYCQEIKSMNENETYGITAPMAATKNCMIPLNSDFGDGRSATSHNIAMSASCSQGHTEHIPIRLTQSSLKEHNSEMEKQLVRMHRETQSRSKNERDRQLIEYRQKKTEHLERCIATDQSTSAGLFPSAIEGHGIKRASKTFDLETEAHKHHCPSLRQLRPRESSEPIAFNTSTVATNIVESPWPKPCSDPTNTFILGMGVPQPISFNNQVTAVPGVFPMYYAPPVYTTVAPEQAPVTSQPANSPYTCNQSPMQRMMYGEHVYGTPVVYGPTPSQVTYGMQQSYFYQNHLDVTPNLFPRPSSQMSPEPITGNISCMSLINEDAADETDGESSYYSNSSFLKIDSGSGEDSENTKSGSMHVKEVVDVPKRSKIPPWMQHVCLTSDLIYKYKVVTKNLQEVLSGDEKRLETMEQSALVNEQLNQLYIDLHLEGTKLKLTLDDGITSTSDEDIFANNKNSSPKMNSELSKLGMIYEENAPFPLPSDNGGLLAPCPPSMFS